jgi:N6-L-threonylcarbamoyladenine synthase
MTILGIETSCDETAAAIIEASGGLKKPRFKVLSNVVSSQVKIHAKYGGVVPTLAKREHQKNLIPILMEALKGTGLAKSKINPIAEQSTLRGRNQKSKIQLKIQKEVAAILEREEKLRARFKKYIVPMKPPRIDLIAVTIGPGLEPALWVGVNFAKALALLWNKPVIPVNHLEGHIYSNWLQLIAVNSNYQLPITKRFTNRKIEFPALCLIVSGGHTELILMRGYGKSQLLGETRDDAAGEAYDKVARLLGLGFPGGPAIDAIASKLPITPPTPSLLAGKAGLRRTGNYQLPINLPRPMIHTKDYDFSFAGLKTAVLYLIRDLNEAGIKKLPIEAIAKEFQDAVIEVLVTKTMRAAKEYKAKTVMISGGVAANSGLRQSFANYSNDYKILFPPQELTTDNAAMIAMAGYINYQLGKAFNFENIKADANLTLQSFKI